MKQSKKVNSNDKEYIINRIKVIIADQIRLHPTHRFWVTALDELIDDVKE